MSRLWRMSLGERGCRVVLFERKPGGVLYREVYVGGKRVAAKKSLAHRDRERAKADAYTMLALLKVRKDALDGGKLTLQTLFDNYIESQAFKAKKRETQRYDQTKLKRVLRYLDNGARDVLSVSELDVKGYAHARLSTGDVRTRTVEADLSVLRAMLNWGVRQRNRRGEPLVRYNPLQGVKLPREQNPMRPVATWERFEKTRAALRDLQETACSTERMRWIKVELALVLAEATGRRRGAIQQLRWEDVNFDKGAICWPHDSDKRGKAWLMPMPEQLADELRKFQRRIGAVGGWMFASERNSGAPMHPRTLTKWLEKAERKAGLPKLQQGLWHPYRRKWGTERKHLPIVDVAAAGGWKDTQTLLTHYQQPDAETLLAVMNEPRKVRERGVG